MPNSIKQFPPLGITRGGKDAAPSNLGKLSSRRAQPELSQPGRFGPGPSGGVCKKWITLWGYPRLVVGNKPRDSLTLRGTGDKLQDSILGLNVRPALWECLTCLGGLRIDHKGHN
ncbi:MAG: hypothetical protein ACUVQG_13140 [Thermogutta sp.]